MPSSFPPLPSPPLSASPSTSPLLSLCEDLIPRGPSPPPSTTIISLSGLLNPPLTLYQDLKEGCGGQTWPAGMVLSEFLVRYKLGEILGEEEQGGEGRRKGKGKGRMRILELGAGSGLVSIALALALSQQGRTHGISALSRSLHREEGPHGDDTIKSPERQPPTEANANYEHEGEDERKQEVEIIATDIQPLLPLLERNIAFNNASTQSGTGIDVDIHAKVLQWGEPLPPSLFLTPSSPQHPTTTTNLPNPAFSPPHPHSSPHTSTIPAKPPQIDILLAADLVYFEPAFPLLISTMQELMPCTSSPETVCYFAFKKRRRADMQILKMLRKGGFVVRDLLGGVFMKERGGGVDEGKSYGEKKGESWRKNEEEIVVEDGEIGKCGRGEVKGEIDMEVGRRWRKEGVYLWEVRRKGHVEG